MLFLPDLFPSFSLVLSTSPSCFPPSSIFLACHPLVGFCFSLSVFPFLPWLAPCTPGPRVCTPQPFSSCPDTYLCPPSSLSWVDVAGGRAEEPGLLQRPCLGFSGAAGVSCVPSNLRARERTGAPRPLSMSQLLAPLFLSVRPAVLSPLPPGTVATVLPAECASRATDLPSPCYALM